MTESLKHCRDEVINFAYLIEDQMQVISKYYGNNKLTLHELINELLIERRKVNFELSSSTIKELIHESITLMLIIDNIQRELYSDT